MAFKIPDGLTAKDEVKSLRRPIGKTFEVSPGRFKSVTSQGLVHYKDRYGDLREINLLLDNNGECNKAPYTVSVYQDKVGYSYRSKKGGRVDVELIALDDVPVDNKRFSVQIEDNKLFWNNVAENIDIRIILLRRKVSVFKNIKSETAPRKFKWLVKEWHDSKCSFVRDTKGKDSTDNSIEMINTVTETTGTEDYNAIFYEEEWTGRVSKRKRNRVKHWDGIPAYPIIIDADTTEDITASGDDGVLTQYSSDSYLIGSNWFGEDPNSFGMGKYYFSPIWYTTNFNMGLRFQLGVPQNAIINSAVIKLITFAAPDQVPVKVYVDNVDDADAWSTNNNPVTGLVKFPVGGFEWTVATTAISQSTSVNVQTMVQQVIDREGWVSEGDIRFGFLNQLSLGETDTRYDDRFHAYDTDPDKAPQLIVDYTVVSPPTAGAWVTDLGGA